MSRQPQDRFPPQIKYLAWNEGCERFSFYGMTSILTIYMVTFLGVREPDAEANYHFFVFAVYLTPLVGAWIADRFLGRYRVILWLSLGYVFGHAAIAIWDSPAGLVLGLALIAIGAGGIKPTAAAYVGDQFDARSQHLLEKVYDLYYWMINLGSFTSMLIIPELLARFGPWVAFSVPGRPHGLRARHLLARAPALRERAAHRPQPERLLPGGAARRPEARDHAAPASTGSTRPGPSSRPRRSTGPRRSSASWGSSRPSPPSGPSSSSTGPPGCSRPSA